MKVKNVVFDLGGVLIDWNPRYLFHKHMSPQDAEWFLTHVCHKEWNEAQDAGRSWREAVEEAIKRHPTHAKWIRMYHEQWEEMIAGAISGTVDVLTQLKLGQIPLYALTNWSSETFPIAKRKFDFLDFFRGTLVSGEEGIKKPDPKIFRLLAQRYNIRPGESLFIDDVEKNVRAAEREGFQVHHFRSAELLRQELIKRGLIFHFKS